MRNLDGLYGHGALSRIHGRPGISRGQTPAEVPDVRRKMEFIQQHNQPIATFACSCDEAIVPIPQRSPSAQTFLEGDLRPAHACGKLQRLAVAPAFAIFLNVQRHFQAGAFAEAPQDHIEDRSAQHTKRQGAASIDQRDKKVVGQQRVCPHAERAQNCHYCTPVPKVCSVISNWFSVRPTRTTTNSNGFTGAMPTRATSWPLARCDAGLVVWSQRTKNAASAVLPANAPFCHSASRKLVSERRSLAWVISSLGSNTAHCVEM